MLRAGVVRKLPIHVVALQAPNEQPDCCSGHRQLGKDLRRPPPRAPNQRCNLLQQGPQGLWPASEAEVCYQNPLPQGPRDGPVQKELQGPEKGNGLNHDLAPLMTL